MDTFEVLNFKRSTHMRHWVLVFESISKAGCVPGALLAPIAWRRLAAVDMLVEGTRLSLREDYSLRTPS